MSEIKRIDPRPPYTQTPQGIRRLERHETRLETASPRPKPLRPRQDTGQWFMAIAHSNRGRIDEHARQVLAAAAILAPPDTGVIAVILGELNEDAAAFGADRIVVLPDFDAARFQPEREVAVAQSLISAYNAKHIFIPDKVDADGDLGRRLIVAHGEPAATHVIEIDATHVSTPWSGGTGFAHAEVPRFVLIEAGAVDANLPFVGRAEKLDPAAFPKVPETHGLCRDLGLEAMDASQIALEEADFIVSAGNGVRNVSTFEALARALGAAVGASRVAVDEGRFARDKQIGATGKTVTASTYVAIGISGAVQHLQGIKDCRHVIAINRDTGAPIVKRADLTIIGDAEEVMLAMLKGIAQARSATKAPEAA